jgi:hypothetical protein
LSQKDRENLFLSTGIITDNKHAIDLLEKVRIHPIDFDG